MALVGQGWDNGQMDREDRPFGITVSCSYIAMVVFYYTVYNGQP